MKMGLSVVPPTSESDTNDYLENQFQLKVGFALLALLTQTASVS